MFCSRYPLSLETVIFLALLLCVQTLHEKRKTYYGDVVLQVTPRTQKDVDFLNNLLMKNNTFELDFWTYPSQPGTPVDIHVPHKNLRHFRHVLRRRTISYRVKIGNLQKLINGERMRARSGVPNFDGAFHSYTQIVHEMNRLADLNGSLARVFSLGLSYENRTMYGIKISSNFSDTNKSVFFINCGIHAREWISISTCMYVARKLVLDYTSDPNVKGVVDKLEWVIVPVVNVDGYKYTRTTHRLWRKNRRPSANGKGCVGTDLNRNFNFRWAFVGADHGQPCSEIYPGAWAFSEVEARNLAVYMYSIRRRMKAYVDFHTYGQLWMSPWGFTRNYPPTYAIQRKAMFSIVLAIFHTNRTVYRFGPAAIAIYTTSGDTIDWTYGVLGVVHSYGVELSPSLFNAKVGFVLPASFIEPVGKETFAGLRALSTFIG